MSIKNEYIERATTSLLQMHPEWDKEEVRRRVSSKVKEKLTNPSILMDNNVTHRSESIDILKLCHWIDQKKPVVSGNATFYMQPDVLRSPTSNMLLTQKRDRKKIKKGMFQYHPDSYEYQQSELAQMNLKVLMNAEYGGSGAKTAAFYTKYSPAATTLMAQSIITTMAAFFEGYIGNNHKFFHINECIDWMQTVCKKKQDVESWISVPTKQEVAERIKQHFIQFDLRDNHIIDRFIENCSDEDLVYLYYANNNHEFIRRHKKAVKAISFILSTLPVLEASEDNVPVEFQNKFDDVDAYNKWVAKEIFLDPYNIPECIKKEMIGLSEMVKKYCFVEYITPSSIIKLNNHKRNTVLLVDTDSNMLHADLFVKFVLDELFPGNTFSRSRLYADMICVNILAAIVDPCVKHLLDYYGRCHNMNDEARAELTMKNEFLFRTFFLMKKKRYGASIVLREGNINIPFKEEIKGIDFIKASVSKNISKKFTKIFCDYVLFAEHMDLHGMIRALKAFEKEIGENVKNGGTEYLKPFTFKTEEAYTSRVDPKTGERISFGWSRPEFRGALIWNALYPEQRIYNLDRVKLIKLAVNGPEDLSGVKTTHPEIYDGLMQHVFHSTNKNMIKNGLKEISLPSIVSTIPDWILPLIDYRTTVSDAMSSFKSVLNALHLELPAIKTPSGKANVISSLISI